MKNKEQNKALDQALDLIVESGADLSNLFKSDGVLKQLTKGLVERALQGELKAHLGYDRHERSDSANARNGTARKSVITEDGLLEIDVPRDRSGEFDPVLVPQRSTPSGGLN
ncbi:transposase, partial [Facilibium subflavum]|uniref:transposase n=1 Tax=Facilibium subflavum TaxID=2219058 RepID=UPI001AADE912